MTVDDAVVQRVTAAWAWDRPVVLPTDTVYGLVAPATNRTAVARMFELKSRPIDRRMAVLVADLAQAGEWMVVNPMIIRLAAWFWPGGLTIVGARRRPAPTWIGDDTTLGVRCPDDELLWRLAAEHGPLAATSANRHGQPTPADAATVATTLSSVRVVVDGGRRAGEPSTVVVVGAGPPEIVREGAIGRAEIAAAVESAP